MLVKSNFFVRHRKGLIICGSIVLVLIVAFFAFGFRSKSQMVFASEREVATVSKGDISVSISGSGSIESASTKNIASEVSATVKSVNVSVGDRVSKGDVLFELDSSDLESQIRSKQKSVTSLQDTVNDYSEEISNLNVKSTATGYVDNLRVAVGDKVSKESVLFDVVDTSVFKLNVEFIYNANAPIQEGDTARIFMSNTFEYLYGRVSYVSDKKEYYEYGGQRQSVEIEIDNPGYNLTGIEANSIVIETSGGATLTSIDSGVFEEDTPTSVKSMSSGTVKSIYIKEGSYVQDGEVVIILENDSLYTSLSDARSSLSDAYTELNDTKDDYSFYTITAPIDGVVTSISVSEGDYVRSESTLAKIVNNYEIEFQIEVDELDILSLEIGQEAKVTIDAIEETSTTPLTGTVSEIALEGTTMNSVTSYPVTISLSGNDEIRIGMNCSAEIIVESAEDVLILPVEAIDSKRDKYYVTLKDGTEKEVEVGIYNEDYIEIVSGLTEGEEVLLPITVMSTSSTTEQSGMMPMGGGFQNFGGSEMPNMRGGTEMPGGGMR